MKTTKIKSKESVFAVVRDKDQVKRFVKWHDEEEVAYAEAERLCKKESDTFLVVRTVLSVEP